MRDGLSEGTPEAQRDGGPAGLWSTTGEHVPSYDERQGTDPQAHVGESPAGERNPSCLQPILHRRNSFLWPLVKHVAILIIECERTR